MLSVTAMGRVSKERAASELLIWICEPKPITLFRTSFLKPITIATERIITANPKAIPIMAIRTAGGVTSRSPLLAEMYLFGDK